MAHKTSVLGRMTTKKMYAQAAARRGDALLIQPRMNVPIIAPSSPARPIKSAGLSAREIFPAQSPGRDRRDVYEGDGRVFEVARDRGSDKGHDGQHKDEERQFGIQDGIRAVDGDLVADIADVDDAGERQK